MPSGGVQCTLYKVWNKVFFFEKKKQVLHEDEQKKTYKHRYNYFIKSVT
jgi:hypothetical protein